MRKDHRHFRQKATGIRRVKAHGFLSVGNGRLRLAGYAKHNTPIRERHRGIRVERDSFVDSRAGSFYVLSKDHQKETGHSESIGVARAEGNDTACMKQA